MVLKRKRSDSEISTSSSILSSPNSYHAMDMGFTSPFNSQFARDITPSHLSSRTRKRHRDNRPSEATIHSNTLSMLYSAQQNSQPIIKPIEATPVPQPATVRNYNSLSSQQTSLHSFWALPSRPFSYASSSASSSPPPPPVSYRIEATGCEDCAGSLRMDGDSMDVDMDVDVLGDYMLCESNYGCSRCGKQVCHKCAISNLGEDRRCLKCATNKRWIGGLGWMDTHN